MASHEAFGGIETAKLRDAVAISEVGGQCEVRYLGETDPSVTATCKLVAIGGNPIPIFLLRTRNT